MKPVNKITEAFGFDGGWSFERRVETKKEEREFRMLVRRLQWRNFAKKWWRTATPEQKAKVKEYRKRWARENKEKVREIWDRAHAKQRADPKRRAAEVAAKRAKRADLSAQRRREIVYTCKVCTVQWCRAFGRIPSRPPEFCSQSCKGRFNYQSGKAAGKVWAMRSKQEMK